MNVTGVIHIDGEVRANGYDATPISGGGGGSGGSIWMYCNIIRGYGRITSRGGRGSIHSKNPGGGGGGGRIAFYFKVNETMSSFRYKANGGQAGDGGKRSENGGAGTVFIYHMLEQHRTLIIDNEGLAPFDPEHKLLDYSKVRTDGCRTWIMPLSGNHVFANSSYIYHFEELQIYGKAHLAMWPPESNINTLIDVFFLYMIGDRSGTVHLGRNHTLDLTREEIDLPFNVRVYEGGFLALAPFTTIHNVTVWLHSTLANIRNLTLHHNGLLSMEEGGHTFLQRRNHYNFQVIRVQDNATIRALRKNPYLDGVHIHVQTAFLEGGGTIKGTDINMDAVNLTIDDGASLHANGLGYSSVDPKDLDKGINVGQGFTNKKGSSGGGHGGTSGRGGGIRLTGQPYGHLFEPSLYGSSGGGGVSVGGSGGGKLWINVTGQLLLDGQIQADGQDAVVSYGGGGSGGSIWIDCYLFRGLGNITANGGNRFPNGIGGGGSGGRIALYFSKNQTYLGGYKCHGGVAEGLAESGGPGTVFLYHKKENHSTLYVNNDKLQSQYVQMITDYSDLKTDSFKAWILPNIVDHWLVGDNFKLSFDEFQIYGNAHLAVLPKPINNGSDLFFRHMIGDRSGYVHIGPYQIMDLHRKFIDLPFNCYIYQLGYLGMAPDTVIDNVFIHTEGTFDHVINMTLVNNGQLRLFQSGSTNRRSRLDYQIPGTTIMKAGSLINASSPFSHPDQYELVFGRLYLEGGSLMNGKNMKISADHLTVDDGGWINVNDGGYLAGTGTG